MKPLFKIYEYHRIPWEKTQYYFIQVKIFHSTKPNWISGIILIGDYLLTGFETSSV